MKKIRVMKVYGITADVFVKKDLFSEDKIPEYNCSDKNKKERDPG
jgi:hypothetical protein